MTDGGENDQQLDRAAGHARAQRLIWLSLAVGAAAVSVALSMPYWRNFEYWAEAEKMWMLYFVLGFVLAVFVFYIFLARLRTLFEHDAIEREADAAATTSSATNSEPRP